MRGRNQADGDQRYLLMILIGDGARGLRRRSTTNSWMSAL